MDVIFAPGFKLPDVAARLEAITEDPRLPAATLTDTTDFR